eukprot:g71816.t1
MHRKSTIITPLPNSFAHEPLSPGETCVPFTSLGPGDPTGRLEPLWYFATSSRGPSVESPGLSGTNVTQGLPALVGRLGQAVQIRRKDHLDLLGRKMSGGEW